MSQFTIACQYKETNMSLTLTKGFMPVCGMTGAANRTSVQLMVNYIINKSNAGEFFNTGIGQYICRGASGDVNFNIQHTFFE
jgi:hypothetical protein